MNKYLYIYYKLPSLSQPLPIYSEPIICAGVISYNNFMFYANAQHNFSTASQIRTKSLMAYNTKRLRNTKSNSLRINTRVYWNPKNTNHNLTDYQYLKCKWLFELLNGGVTILNTNRGFILNYTTCKCQKPLNLLPLHLSGYSVGSKIPSSRSFILNWRSLLSHNYPLYYSVLRSSK
jgi:hypothetical protein